MNVILQWFVFILLLPRRMNNNDDSFCLQENIIRMPQQFQNFIEYKDKLSQLVGVAEANRLVAEGLMSITLGGNDYVNNYYLLPVSARSVQYTVSAYTQFIISEYKKYLRVNSMLFF